MSIELTPILISSVAGIVMSLVFEYLPVVSTWYNKLLNNYQKLIMLGVMAVIVASIYAFNCLGWFTGYIPVVSCSSSGREAAVLAFIAAMIANQATYLVTPKRGDRD